MKLPFETQAGAKSLEEIDLKPTKAICVGRNYRAHAKELGNEVPLEPLIFMKPTSALCGSGDAIVRPGPGMRIDHEGELVAVIGKKAQGLTPENALAHVLGYTLANDVTARELQGKGPWLRAKGMDSFLPIGPKIVGGLEPSALALEVRVNGELRQSGNTKDWIFSLTQVLCFITKDITLMPHDLVLTGTPAGVGNMAPGDVVEVSIPEIGTLRNPVVERPLS